MSDLAFRSATELTALIKSRALGCEELLRHVLDRGERYNGALNAIVCFDTDAALRAAQDADAALARGEVRGPLHGLPITVKESFDVAGLPTTWGLPPWKDNVAGRDAAAVHRLRAAGAVIFGKTNVPPALADWQTFNPIHGTTNNPWDLTRTPGGSSGGAAAALAAGLTGLEIGSDIAGSIRGPSHYCGVYGHKPTYGIVSLEGHALPGRSALVDLIVGGPMARSAADLDLATSILAGPSAADAVAWRLDLPGEPPAGRYRIAVLADHPTAPVDGVVKNAILDLGGHLQSRGHHVDFDARPGFDGEKAHDCFIMLLRAATSIGLDAEALEATAAAARRFAPEDRTYPALMARGNALRHSDWLKLDEARHAIMRDWQRFFTAFDLLLAPIAATAAFSHNQHGERWERMMTVDGRPQPSTTQMFWAGFSGMAYLPSTVAPIARSPDGLPIGVQIIGPEFGDRRCIAFARYLEDTHYRFVAPPGYG